MRRGWATLFWAMATVASARAHAQAAPPTVSQLIVDPDDAGHLALRSTSGLMLSHDGGATWDWRSKAGMGYRGRAEPAVAILHGGALVLGVTAGALAGDRAGCDFKPAAGIEPNVVDVVAIPETPAAALAVSVAFATSTSTVWQSLDGGKTFRALGAPVPRFTALSLRIAASPNGSRGSRRRVYMTGLLWAQSVQGAFAISDDGGKTFTVTAIDGSDSGSQPFIAAIDPKRPDTVYVRFTGTPGRLRASEDAGRTFREVLSLPGPLQAFALSPAGDELLASSLEAGTYRADAASLSFTRVACEGVPCLAWAGTSLLGCGQGGRHGFLVGRSVDEGRRFEALLDAARLTPARCDAGTSVGAGSARDWPRVAASIGALDGSDAGAAEKLLDLTCFRDGGGEQGDSGPGGPVPRAGARRSSARACGCTTALGRPSERPPWSGAVSLLVPLLIARRLRRRRPARCGSNGRESSATAPDAARAPDID